MRITYIAIGDEILHGETREGNGAFFAETLGALGLNLDEMRVVGDEASSTIKAVQELAAEPSLIVTSGGIGPTDDDGTREAVSRAAGVPLEVNEEVAAVLAERYARLGRPHHDANRRQAGIPRGADILENPFGTAPGFAVEVGRSVVAVMPGVPREFRAMLGAFLPGLLQRCGVAFEEREEVTLRVFGTTEAELQGILGDLPGYDGVHVRSLPTFPEIRLAVSPKGAGGDARAYCDAAREALGWRIFSEDKKERFAAAVLRDLEQAQLTLAVAESCTGGLIGHMVTAVPGASHTYVAGICSYANEAKTALLGVPAGLIEEHGAVSEPVARAMAEGARERTGASVAVATTGIAGPGGGTAEKPVGTFHVGLATPDGTIADRHFFPGLRRRLFKRLAAYVALSTIRRWLAER